MYYYEYSKMKTPLHDIPEEGTQAIILPVDDKTIVNSPAFKHALKEMKEVLLEEIERGEFGVLAYAKSKAPQAIKNVYRLAKHSEDDRVKLQANLKMIELAGVRPPVPVVTESPERLIDSMTAEEADLFAREKIWPERFRDQLARLATSVIKKNEAERWAPKVETDG